MRTRGKGLRPAFLSDPVKQRHRCASLTGGRHVFSPTHVVGDVPAWKLDAGDTLHLSLFNPRGCGGGELSS